MIARDGAKESLWQHTAEELKTTATQGRHLRCNHSGCRHYRDKSWVAIANPQALICIVLEANSICFGTTGGTTAHINTLFDTPYPGIIKDFGKTMRCW